MNSTHVSNCKFESIASNERGGCISIVINVLKVISCNSFVSCSTADEAGAIYAANGQSLFAMNTFLICYSKRNTNDKFGNAIFTKNSDTNVSFCSLQQCGPSAKLCSDSGIALHYKVLKVTSVNCTSNYGIVGGSLVTIWYCKPGSNITFSQCSEGSGDFAFFEYVHCGGAAHRCNFINGSQLSHLISCWETSVVYDLLFMNTDTTINGPSITLINCFSNIKIQDYDITVADDIILHNFKISTNICPANRDCIYESIPLEFSLCDKLNSVFAIIFLVYN